MKKKILIVFVLILSVFSLTACPVRNDLAPITDKWIPECDDSVAIVSSVEEKILLNGKTYEISEQIQEQFAPYFIHGVHAICVNDNILYGVHERQYNTDVEYGWRLYRIDLATQTFEILCTKGKMEFYETNYPLVYVKDAVIYIYDGSCTVTYDTNKEVLNELPKEDFEMPNEVSPWGCIAPGHKYEFLRKDDNSTLVIKNKESLKTVDITFDYIADRSEYFNQIREYGAKIRPSKFRNLPSDIFTVDAVCVLNDSIYLRVMVGDVDNDATGIVFRYDFESDTFHYLYHEYVGDHSLCKVIPVY